MPAARPLQARAGRCANGAAVKAAADKDLTGASGGISRSRRFSIPLLSSVLAAVTIITFLGAARNGFVNYDDPDYITHNVHVTTGLNWTNLVWAFETSHSANWHPVTWISHMLDCQFFGLNPAAHHMVSVLIHAAAAVLLFLALNRMTKSSARSFVVAALFGLHPLRVESVVWACERKDVLSAFFWMLTLWFYAGFCRGDDDNSKQRRLFHGLAILSYAIGLLSKSMLVSLPVILLLLDYWPLGRWQRANDKSSCRRLVIEKIPFFALAFVTGIITLVIQGKAGAVKTITTYPLDARIGNAIVSYCRYIGKLFYPVKLAAFYPHPVYWPLASIVCATLLLGAVSLGAFQLRRSKPYLLVGWTWYLVTALPVIGLIQVGAQSMADRYTYIPTIGLLLSIVWGISDVTKSWPWRRPALISLTALALGSCILLTVRQIAYWHDSVTLFRHTISVTRRNPVAHMNLGVALFDSGHTSEGLSELRTAVQLAPYYAEAHLSLGTALERVGKYDRAISELDETLRFSPKSAKAYLEAGVVFNKMRHPADAAKVFQRAIELDPNYADAYNDLGVVLEQTGNVDKAEVAFKEALRCDRDHANAHQNLGALYYKGGRIKDAVSQFSQALRLRPNSAKAHNNLGGALFLAGRYDEAIAHYQAALRLEPGFPGAQANLNAAMAAKAAADKR
jgi:protein O-mannosyl-transferase